MSPFADEDEKTTIESGWEEEASTTIEQGEVAEKIRTLGLRPITNVTGSTSNGHVMDEPTMDDQQANAGLSMITPAAIHARMIITAGNDQGQEIEIIPGKTYTVGRAIENDIVLTDIAVSRKHFDLRFEGASWVLVDRGSGNGTVINGNIEDAPFMLANGDSIEIGNTTFRFDNPHGVPRHAFAENAPTTAGFGTGAFDTHGANGFANDQGVGAFDAPSNVVTRDSSRFDSELEEEPSTVAGKPLRDVAPEPAYDAPFSRPEPARMERPPSPRPAPRPPSPRPERPKTAPPPTPPPAPLPRPKASSAVPFAQPLSPPMPSMLGAPPPLMPPPLVHGSQGVPAIGSHRPTMLAHGAAPEPLLNMMPTTIPGQGPPMQPSSPQVHALPFTYPNMADHAQHAQHASAQHLSAQLGHMQVVSTTGARDATSTAHVPPTPYNGMPALQQTHAAPATLSRRMKLILAGAGLTVLAAVATIAIIKGGSGSEAAPVEEPKPETETKSPPETKPTVRPTAQPIDDKKVATPKDPPKDVKKDPPKDVKKTEANAPEIKKDLPKDPPKEIAKKDPPVEIKKDPPKDPPKEIAKKDPPVEIKKDLPKDPPKEIKKDPPKKDPPKEVVKKDPPKDPPKEIKKTPPKKETRVAVATVKKDPPKVDSSGATEKAKSLYAQKQFLDAANTLKAAAGSDASLRTLAAGYEKFATNYAVGMRQTAKPIDAWMALRSAMIFDTNFGGGVHGSEIQSRRTAIAAKAALGLASTKNYTEAVVALKLTSATDGDAGFARRLVNEYAATLYEEAKNEMDTNRKVALNKLRQVKLLTGSGTLFNKADKLLSGNSG